MLWSNRKIFIWFSRPRQAIQRSHATPATSVTITADRKLQQCPPSSSLNHVLGSETSSIVCCNYGGLAPTEVNCLWLCECWFATMMISRSFLLHTTSHYDVRIIRYRFTLGKMMAYQYKPAKCWWCFLFLHKNLHAILKDSNVWSNWKKCTMCSQYWVCYTSYTRHR